MSDIQKGLPIRTENNADAVIAISDAIVTSRTMTVNADGSINITDNGGSITVDGSVTVSATDLDIRDLSHTQDSVKIGDGTDFLAVNNDGSVNITDNGGSITIDASDLDIRDLAFATDKVDVSGSTVALDAPTLAALESVTVQNGAGASAVNIQDGGNSITVDATDLDIRDLSHTQDSVKIGDGADFLAVNADGSINVVVTDSTPGAATNDYNTAAAIAGGASSVHTYTSTGNFYLTQIETGASGRMKIEVAVDGATKFVKFSTESDPNISITLSQPILATNGQTVTVTRTNRQNQAQDVYSTISGYTL